MIGVVWCLGVGVLGGLGAVCDLFVGLVVFGVWLLVWLIWLLLGRICFTDLWVFVVCGWLACLRVLGVWCWVGCCGGLVLLVLC